MNPEDGSAPRLWRADSILYDDTNEVCSYYRDRYSVHVTRSDGTKDTIPVDQFGKSGTVTSTSGKEYHYL